MSDPYTPSNSKGTIFNGNNTNGINLRDSDLSRILPRQLSTGTLRGTQSVGYGNTKIDGSNNRITIGTPDGGQIGIGAIPGSTTNEYGFFALDSNNNVIMKIVGPTWFVDNPDDGTNVMQSGELPDGTYGWAVAKTGKNVSDGFS